MSKEAPDLDLSMGKSKEEIEVESAIELLEAGMDPNEIAQMALRSRALLRIPHARLDDKDDELEDMDDEVEEDV